MMNIETMMTSMIDVELLSVCRRASRSLCSLQIDAHTTKSDVLA